MLDDDTRSLLKAPSQGWNPANLPRSTGDDYIKLSELPASTQDRVLTALANAPGGAWVVSTPPEATLERRYLVDWYATVDEAARLFDGTVTACAESMAPPFTTAGSARTVQSTLSAGIPWDAVVRGAQLIPHWTNRATRSPSPGSIFPRRPSETPTSRHMEHSHPYCQSSGATPNCVDHPRGSSALSTATRNDQCRLFSSPTSTTEHCDVPSLTSKCSAHETSLPLAHQRTLSGCLTEKSDYTSFGDKYLPVMRSPKFVHKLGERLMAQTSSHIYSASHQPGRLSVHPSTYASPTVAHLVARFLTHRYGTQRWQEVLCDFGAALHHYAAECPFTRLLRNRFVDSSSESLHLFHLMCVLRSVFLAGSTFTEKRLRLTVEEHDSVSKSMTTNTFHHVVDCAQVAPLLTEAMTRPPFNVCLRYCLRQVTQHEVGPLPSAIRAAVLTAASSWSCQEAERGPHGEMMVELYGLVECTALSCVEAVRNDASNEVPPSERPKNTDRLDAKLTRECSPTPGTQSTPIESTPPAIHADPLFVGYHPLPRR